MPFEHDNFLLQWNAEYLGIGYVRWFGYQTVRVRSVPNSKGQNSMQHLEDKHVCYNVHDLKAYQEFHSSDLETVHHWAADRPPVLFVDLHHIA